MVKEVLCFGEVLWDTFLDEKKPGGAPMNVAMHLKQQGAHAILASRIGTDEPGEELIQYLKENNLYSDLIQQDQQLPTCAVNVVLDDDLQATYIIPTPVSWDNIQPDTKLISKAKNASVIVFGSLACRNEKTKDTLVLLLDCSALKVFDVNLRGPHYELSTIEKLAGLADIIKMNEQELDFIAGFELMHFTQIEKIIFLSDFFDCATICVTRGENGSIVFHHNVLYEHPGFYVKVADTVGAGDSFLATFIAGLLRKECMEVVLEQASAIGAYVASSRGANPVYDLPVIEKIRSSRNELELRPGAHIKTQNL